ncbi:MAG: FAD binding domain-containing protein [Deltaproteobacteria bacterium]|nr:FAD binding domain-containing protein [Deltaproteobacteria bacterium]MBW2128881.1 FAD binding domain-containing protein [Deltaproteobacteria bacterium]MBW2305048.1 FAD binding domain-containing protein [Deltaproteobacteria bacterium]
MIALKFEFRRPKDVEEAVRLYGEFQGEAAYLSGGTDLVPRMKLGLEKPKVVIDLKRISPLSTVEDQGEWIRIGALARIFDLKENETIKDYFPALKASLEATSCESLQMRGTIGGNLLQNSRCLFYNQSEFWRRSKGFCLKMGGKSCNAIPGANTCFANYCSDNAPALCTLSAEIEFSGPDGTRRLNLEELYTGRAEKPFKLYPGELLTAIFVPKKKSVGGYEKLRIRGAIDYPLLGVGFSYGNGTGKLTIGAVGPKPHSVEMKQFSQGAIQEAAETLLKQVRPVDNTVVNPEYRKRMVPVLAERLVNKVMEGVK